MTQKARSRRSFRRRQPSLQPNDRVLIVCEGAKTEPNYFDSLWRSLRVSTIDVEIVPKGAVPITVVDEAVSRDRKNRRQSGKGGDIRYDKVWCVFDVEIPHENQSLLQALDMAKANGISVALSNPCFEYWILLHFERTGYSFNNCADVIRRLGNSIPNYKKGGDIYQRIKGMTDTAIQNAKSIEKQYPLEDPLVERNPYTQVYQLVEYLHNMAQKQYPT